MVKPLLLTAVPEKIFKISSECMLTLVLSALPAQDVLGAPGDGRVGVPGAGAHHPGGSGRLLQRDDGRHLRLLHARGNPQQLHLGPDTHRYTTHTHTKM